MLCLHYNAQVTATSLAEKQRFITQNDIVYYIGLRIQALIMFGALDGFQLSRNEPKHLDTLPQYNFWDRGRLGLQR